MALYVYVTPECEQDARNFHIEEEIAALRDRLEEEQRLLPFSRYFPYLCRPFARQERLIMKEESVGKHRVLFFLRIYKPGDPSFRRFTERNQRIEFGNRELNPLIPPPLELASWIASREQEPEIGLRPMSDAERIALNYAFGGTTSGFSECYICETEEWVKRITHSDMQHSLFDVARTLISILDAKDETGVRLWPVKDRSDLKICARYFPGRLVLIAPLIGGSDDGLLIEKYSKLFDKRTPDDAGILKLSASNGVISTLYLHLSQ